MAYVRDDKTGKFTWVEGVLGDHEDVPYVAPGKRAKKETSPTTLLMAALIVGVLALITTWGMKAFKEPGVAIRRIHNHPAEFDGHQVTVHGTVGEVFPVGGSYAYYLMQGRDTIVVFTRGGRPASRRNAEVHGSVSIGYLDGVPRPALFENGLSN
jgi:hypothetical protein